MSFEVGRLSAALTLDGVSEFHGQLDAAGRKLTETGQRGASFGRAAETAVRTAAGATTGLVAAGGAYLTMLTRTGVAYNSLQQNSRAALKVIMGGTQQANEQMSKLDDFARNSPFSKSVFIQAQQQLLGFGMEAKKVIPTLDAVQQSMAAMGRGNEDITEVVNILANVQSTGKLTAETLNQLGYRGLDAAELIGKGMSKTGNQIKESITKGTLDGREALDVLVTQMQKRFGGAADGVKEQWSGATDRIKAATRDLGAHIAEPFVSAEGGGMAVKWGNQVADVLRAIEKQSIPVMGILTQRGAPLFAGLTRDLDAAKMAVARWNPASLELSLDKLAGHAPGIAALGGALLALGGQVGPLGRMLSILGLSVNPVLAAFAGLAAASPELRGALMELLSAGKPLIPVVGDLAKILSGALNSALPLVSGGVEALTSVLRPLLQIVAGIPAPVLAGAAAFLAVHRGLKDLGPAFQGVGLWMRGFQDQMRVQQSLAAMSTSSMSKLETATVGMARSSGRELGTLGAAASVAGARVTGLGDALKTAFLSNPIGIALTVVATAVGLWAQANAEAQAKVQAHESRVAELRGTLDKTTGSLTDASREMVAQAASTDEMAKKLQDAGTSGQAFTRALTEGGAVAKVFRDELVQSTKQSMKNEANLRSVGSVAKDLGLSYNEVVESMLGFKDSSEKVETASKRLSGDAYIEMQQRLAQMKDNWKNEASAQREVVAAYEEQQAAIEQAQQVQIRLNAAAANARASMSDAGRALADYNTATAISGDSTKSLEERVRALKQAYDILTGGASSAAEAQAQVDAANLTLSEGFARVDENGTKMWASAVDLGAQATKYVNTSSRYGQELFGALKTQQDSTLQASIVARDTAINSGKSAEEAFGAARSAAEQYNSGLSETLKQAGLTGEAHKKLYDEWSIQPDVAAFTVTDNGTMDETRLQALQLAIQVEKTPDKSIKIDAPGSPELIKVLESLGFKVEKIPGTKQIRVSQVGAEGVDAAISNAARNRESTITVTTQYIDTPRLPVSSLLAPPGRRFAGGIDTAAGQHFAAGGGVFPSGLYQGVVGGIPKMGADGRPHVFAERELGVPWEAYISGNPSFRERNIGLALEALRRLAFPVIPATALGGVRQFAAGGGLTPSPTTAPAAAPVPIRSRFERRQRTDGPLVGTAIFGEGTTRNDLTEFEEALDRLRRS